MTKAVFHIMATTVLLVVFSACAPLEIRTELQRISIADDVVLVLPRADEITASFDATQVIVAEYGEQTHSFEAHLEVRPGKITIVAVNALGVVLFAITYDGVELLASGVVAAQVINAEYVLADVLLSHWDPTWLRARIQGASLEHGANGQGRALIRNGAKLIEIEYESGEPWTGNVRLTHIERGYTLLINTVEFASK